MKETNSSKNCPTKMNLLNQTHFAFSPVQAKFAILYVSGSRQITEFRIDDAGFRAFVWVQSRDGSEIELVHYIPSSPSPIALWSMLENDCLAGHARLSDRASVRGVGGNPNNRKIYRATDDVAAVCNWIRRAESWFDARTAKERAAILQANASLCEGIADPAKRAEKRLTEKTAWMKIKKMPVAIEEEIATNPRVRAAIGANTEHVHLIMGSVKHWDDDGCIAVRGKRMAGNKISEKIVTTKKQKIAMLRNTVNFQLGKAADNALEGNDLLAEVYMEMAQETEARVNALQAQLNARMAKARATRDAKKAAKVTISPDAAEAIADDVLRCLQEFGFSAEELAEELDMDAMIGL